MTDLLEVLIVGLILSTDSFSAALALGSTPHKFKDTLKFAFSSGGAETLIAFLGAIMGNKIVTQFDSIDHWISFALLSFIAAHMAYEGICDLKFQHKIRPKKFHSFFKILIVSFATSLDAFAFGVSLGLSEKPLFPFLISIGFFAFMATILGMEIAKKASYKLGPTFSLIGSTILLALAFKLLIEGL